MSRRALAAALFSLFSFGVAPLSSANVCEVEISNPDVYTLTLLVDTTNDTVDWMSGVDGGDAPAYWTPAQPTTMTVSSSPAGVDLPDDPVALRQYFIQPDWVGGSTSEILFLAYQPNAVAWHQGSHVISASNFAFGQSAYSRIRIPTDPTVIFDIIYVEPAGQGVLDLVPGWSVDVANCATPVGPGQEVTIDLSGSGNDPDDTAVRLKNQSANTGSVSAEFVPGSPLLQGDSVKPGFQLVDGTLRVQSDIPSGQLRARYRVEYDIRAIRRAGLRANQLRLMRRDSQNGVWVRAIDARANPVAGRYLRADADFELGHHGFSPIRRYAWAVVDVNSRYAVGGPELSSVPVLAPVGLFTLGGALIGLTWWESRRRR